MPYVREGWSPEPAQPPAVVSYCVLADFAIDACDRPRIRRALRDGLSQGEVRAMFRHGDEPFSWERA